MGQGLKYLATEAVRFVPVLGPVLRSAIAGGIIESLGRGIVGHFERKHPGKTFEKK
jgi:uncharacterized protein (DUF697 family)